MTRCLRDKEAALVSVIIPCYNRQSFLVRCIGSVFNQHYRPIECIIVDDGSIDDSAELIEKLKSQFNCSTFSLIYAYQSNAGAPAARNLGISMARGEFIQFLDSDDLLAPNKISEQVTFLIQNPEADIVFGNWEIDSGGERKMILPLFRENFSYDILCKQALHTLSPLLRKKCTTVYSWDTSLKRNQEIDYFLMLYRHGCKFNFLPKVTGTWFRGEHSRIGNSGRAAAIIQFYKKWENILIRDSIWDDDFRVGFTNNFIYFLNEFLGRPAELKLLISAINQLSPEHSMFQGSRFKTANFLFGKTVAHYLLALYLSRNI